MPAENDIAVLDIQVNTNADAATQSLKALQTQAGTTADSVKGLTTATQAQAPAALTAAAGARQLTTEMGNSLSVTRDFRDVMHSVDPILRTAGASIGGFGQFAMAARAGVVGLGIAITGSLLVELQQAADGSKKAQDAITALLNSAAPAAGAFAALQQSAAATGSTVASLVAPFSSIYRTLQQVQQQSGVVFAPLNAGMSQTAAQAKDITQTLMNYGKAFGETTNEASKSAATIGAAMQKSKQFTVDLFKTIEQESPILANALANAFGYTGEDAIVRFEARLDAAPMSMQNLIAALRNLGPASQQAFEQSGAGFANLTQGADTLWNSVKRLNDATGTDTGLTGSLKRLNQALVGVEDGSAKWSDVLLTLDEEMLGAGVKAVNALETGFIDLGAATATYFANLAAQSPIIQSIINGLGGLANAAVSAAAKLASAIFAGGNASGGGSQQNAIYPELAGQNPYSSTGGGVAPADQTNFNLFNSGYSTDQISALNAMPTDLAEGGMGTVPMGYKHDSYQAEMNLTEGEQVIVVPPHKTLSDILSGGGKPINLGRRAEGANIGIGSGGAINDQSPSVDQAITPQGGAIMSLVNRFSGVFGQVGDTLDSVKTVVSAAGNGKTNDVIRLSSIQMIGAISLGFNDLGALISSGDSQIVAAIGSMSSTIAAAASSSASSASSPSVTSVAASGGGGGFRAAPGGGINNPNDPFGMSAIEKALGYGTDSGSPAKSQTPAAAATKPPAETGTGPAQVNTVGGAIPGSGVGSSIPGVRNQPYDPDTSASMPGALTADPSTSAGLDAYTADFAPSAGGNEFIVPGGGGTDSVRLQGMVTPGEHVKITPKADVSGGKGAPNSRTSPGIQNITLNLNAKDYNSFVKSKSQLGQDARVMLDRALQHG